MFTKMKKIFLCFKVNADSWLRKVFQEQANSIKLFATLVSVSIVLIHAFSFKDQLVELVKNLWGNLIIAA